MQRNVLVVAEMKTILLILMLICSNVWAVYIPDGCYNEHGEMLCSDYILRGEEIYPPKFDNPCPEPLKENPVEIEDICPKGCYWGGFGGCICTDIHVDYKPEPEVPEKIDIDYPMTTNQIIVYIIDKINSIIQYLEETK